jgi:hypothetical protein
VQALDLAIVVGFSIAARLERPPRLLLELLLPGVNLVGVNLIALCQIGHRRLFSQRLQGDLRLQRTFDLPSRSLSHRPLRNTERRLLQLCTWSHFPGPV